MIVKGPDFPTGGMILGTAGINEAYRTGRGKVRVRAVTRYRADAKRQEPYRCNRTSVHGKQSPSDRENRGAWSKIKRVDGITDLRDESDRQGMRVCIELRRDVNPNVVLNQLFKHTQLQDTFGVIMLALVNNEPKVLNLLRYAEILPDTSGRSCNQTYQIRIKQSRRTCPYLTGLTDRA